MNTLTKSAALALAFAAVMVMAIPSEAAPRYRHSHVFVWRQKQPRLMIIRERGEPPRVGYIGPGYKSSYGIGYHTNGPGIGIER